VSGNLHESAAAQSQESKALMKRYDRPVAICNRIFVYIQVH
jgi:hypothetical protein